MAQAGDKTDVGLAGAGHIEDRETFRLFKPRAELLESAAHALQRRQPAFRSFCGGLLRRAKSHSGREVIQRGSDAQRRTTAVGCSAPLRYLTEPAGATGAVEGDETGVVAAGACGAGAGFGEADLEMSMLPLK